MAQRSIEQTIRGILEQNKDDAVILKDMLPLWQESYKASSEETEKNLLRFLFFFFLFAMIDSAQLSKISVFGVDFQTAGIPMLVTYVTCVLLYYRCMSLFFFSQIVEEAIREANYQFFKAFQLAGLCDLSVYPSVPQIENTLANLEEDKNSFPARLASAWTMGETIVIVFAPLLAMIWASYALVRSMWSAMMCRYRL